MAASRANTIAKNSAYSVACQTLTLLMQFVVRTFFIKCLTIEYLGVNGLFSNILTILSFADLGLVNAINYSLYKPLAEHDDYKVAQLMTLYQKVYRIIAVVVLVIGLSLIPFLDFFVKEKPDIAENFSLVYVFFVVNTAVSFLFAYKQTLIIADQKKYVVALYTFFITSAICIVQCAELYWLHSFYLYLALMVVNTVAVNVFIARKCHQMYPAFSIETPEPLSKAEKSNIFENVKALAIYKFCNVSFSGTSNIILSKLFGVAIVGLCSNVYYVVNAGMGILVQVLNSFVATLGNLNAVESRENKIKAFYKTTIFCFWLYGFVCTGLMLYMNDFLRIWLGEGFTVDNLTILAIVLIFYMDNVTFALCAYRTTMGLFSRVKYNPIAGAILNIVLGVVLGKSIGPAGVFLAIPITRFLFINIFDMYVVFKYGLEDKPYKLLWYMVVFPVFSLAVYYMLVMLGGTINFNNSILTFIVKCLIFGLIYNILFYACFHRMNLFKDILRNISSILAKKRKS